jgi:hypothetical protein
MDIFSDLIEDILTPMEKFYMKCWNIEHITVEAIYRTVAFNFTANIHEMLEY